MTFKSNMTIKGCSMSVFITECDCLEDIEELPFVEHTISVYGASKLESQERWQEVTNKLNLITKKEK
jgi:hypothetical protein